MSVCLAQLRMPQQNCARATPTTATTSWMRRLTDPGIAGSKFTVRYASSRIVKESSFLLLQFLPCIRPRHIPGGLPSGLTRPCFRSLLLTFISHPLPLCKAARQSKTKLLLVLMISAFAAQRAGDGIPQAEVDAIAEMASTEAAAAEEARAAELFKARAGGRL